MRDLPMKHLPLLLSLFLVPVFSAPVLAQDPPKKAIESEEALQIVFANIVRTAYLSVLSFDWSTTPDEAIDQASSIIQAEYDNVEKESFSPELISHPGPLADTRGLELYFYYLDLLVRAKLIAFGIPHQTILVQFQAEDSEFASMERVFDAMLLTLCQSMTSKKDPDEIE